MVCNSGISWLVRLAAAVAAVASGLVSLQGQTASPAPTVVDSHPRLFFRAGGGSPGTPTLALLKTRARDPRSQRYVQELKGSLPNLALRAVLLDDAGARQQAIKLLNTDFSWKEITTDEGVELCFRAMAYDWLFDQLTPDTRDACANRMVAAADRLIRELESGGHVFHTRMYGWATGITLAGLALEGHHPEATRLWKYGGAYYRDRLMPARQLQDGTVHNGFGYGRKYTMWMTGHFLSCWLSATGQNLWTDIRQHQGDWARRETQFLIYGRYPDGSHLRFGDSYSLFSDAFSFRAVSERTAAYLDPVGQGFLNQLLREADTRVPAPQVRPSPLFDTQNAYTYFLFYDPELPAASPASLPARQLFSRDGTGMVVWKTGWGAEDTTVFFKCGDYFENHGHFDQGHLDVFRRVPLLIDSGSYLTFAGRFRTDYWHRTVAHNSVLVLDPANLDEGGQRVFSSQSDASLEEYRRNPLPEGGTILDYGESAAFAWVAGDYTAAYPRDRVRRITRELALLDNRFLVVVDRVETPRPELVPTVLWHCPVEPSRDSSGVRFEIARKGSVARVYVLAPKDARAKWVEGFQAAGVRVQPEGELRPIPDMGVGRMEVSATAPGREHIFVHLIDIGDEVTPAAEVGFRLEDSSFRVRAGSRSLRFRRTGPGAPVLEERRR